MAPGKPRLQLGESWVVEGEEISEYSPEEETAVEIPTKKSRRQLRANNKSPEPELVMPSLDSDTLEGSWMAESTSRSPRQRRSADKRQERKRNTEFVSNGSPKKQSKPKPKSPLAQPIEETSAVEDLIQISLEHTKVMLSWMVDVLGNTFKVLKTPISYFLAIWLCCGFMIIAKNFITNSVYASLSPICRIPGASLLPLPFCPIHNVDTSNGPPPPVEFDQLMAVQSKFEEVLEESADSISLPLDMKRGEASIRDLRQLVRYSSLSSKNELVHEFDGFIDTARIASYDLQKFNSHVGRAVDSVISTTRWTSRVLDGIQERDAGRGMINAFINEKVLAPFQPIKFTESILLDQYIQHTRIVEEEISRLIGEAQVLLMVLNNLDDRLEVIHGIATRDGMRAEAEKAEILTDLWTWLGGNKGQLQMTKTQIALLRQVVTYRQTAYAHVSATILRLQAIGAGLEDLRERVATPEMLRDRLDIPLSVHIENIQRGVERHELDTSPPTSILTSTENRAPNTFSSKYLKRSETPNLLSPNPTSKISNASAIYNTSSDTRIKMFEIESHDALLELTTSNLFPQSGFRADRQRKVPCIKLASICLSIPEFSLYENGTLQFSEDASKTIQRGITKGMAVMVGEELIPTSFTARSFISGFKPKLKPVACLPCSSPHYWIRSRKIRIEIPELVIQQSNLLLENGIYSMRRKLSQNVLNAAILRIDHSDPILENISILSGLHIKHATYPLNDDKKTIDIVQLLLRNQNQF
ncbi:hypothetical protein B7494_g8234 [Chlorociboria aeruginascens]|nr:hypothetical protein B7494_g8234 [Chlorociboria aeruginascens]